LRLDKRLDKKRFLRRASQAIRVATTATPLPVKTV
jgi:hypothetical protein